jgi:hypothetical protein
MQREIEKMQREIEEMKEKWNSSLWNDSPHQNSGQNRRTPKEKKFVGNRISQFVDPHSPLSIGLQTAPRPPKFKPVSLLKYNGSETPDSSSWDMNQPWIQEEEMMSR